MKIKRLLLSFICLISLFIVTGCGTKTAISAEDFKVAMDVKDFRLIDVTDQLGDTGIVKQCYVAMSPDSTYQIEFYEFNDSKGGSDFYAEKLSNFETNKESNQSIKTVKIFNQSKTTVTGSNEYKVVSCIGNTAIYVDADIKYKDEIATIIDELGY